MKRIFTLLTGGLSLLFIACDSDKEGSGSEWFLTPESTVNGTTVEVRCGTKFGEGVLTSSNSGFAYAVWDSNGVGAFKTTATATFSDGTMRATLSGLQPETRYVVYAYADLGAGRMQSVSDTFETGQATSLPDPDPDPDPNPDPTPSGPAKYSGWAELPVEHDADGNGIDDNDASLYYAHHICPDFRVDGHLARNYTVCYSDDLKCAIWVAAPMHTCYAKKNTDRTDAYREDPDIPVSQPGQWDGYTRGHLLGSSERRVSNATNRQVFYYSNIAPQFGQPYFNTGGGAWNTLEKWVDTQWENKADTTYQVIGCYWADRNKKVNGTTIPTHFYKVLLRTKDHKNKWVVDCSRDELQCIAVMIEHRTYSKSEVPQPGQYVSKGLLMSVQALEEKTGLTFFANVPNAPKDTYNPSDWGL